jgi:hypothetical protein
MSDVGEIKISEMGPAGALSGSEIFPIVQVGANKKSTIDAVLVFTENNIEISESQVTNLTDDLDNKQPLNDILTEISNLTTDGAIVKLGLTVNTQEVLSTNGISPGGFSNIVGRDSNGNTAINNILMGLDFRNAIGTPVNLSADSGKVQIFDFGSVATDILMPDATTLIPGWSYKIINTSTASVTVKTHGGGTICILPVGASVITLCLTTSFSSGTWEFFVDVTQNLSSGGVLFGNTEGFPIQDSVNFSYNDLANQLNVTNCTVGNTVVSPANGLYVEGSIKNNALTASQLVVTDGLKNLTSLPLLSGALGGTGVNNGSNTIRTGGNISTAGAFTTSGAFSVTQTYTGTTNVTFPTSGTLATITKSSRTITSDTTLTASDNGSIIYCNSENSIVITAPQQTTEALLTGFNCKIINRNIGDVRTKKEGFDVLLQANNIIGQGDEADIYLVDAGTPNTWQMEGGTPVFPISYCWDLSTGSNASFIICGIIPAYTVFNQAYFKTNSGTITGVLTINGTSITGTMAMSSTENYASLTSPNVATPGSRLGITTSSNSSATFAHVTVTGYQRYYLS